MTAVKPSSSCGCGGGNSQLVYALGELGTDFGSEARRDSYTQDMLAYDENLLDYLEKNPWAAQNLIWTLNLEATPIYAIVPMGAYAPVAFERLRSAMADNKVERVVIPGYVNGSIQLMSGQTVPTIIPEVRGMSSWSNAALIESVAADEDAETKNFVEEYLNRIYYDYSNLGVTPQERALNFSATNVYQILQTIINNKTENRPVLDKIEVLKSPVCRSESECYDVKLIFFDPENSQRARRVYRFAVDVSDVIPVLVGKLRSWTQSV
jgi:cyanobactin maturation PatA/PatG family protease